MLLRFQQPHLQLFHLLSGELQLFAHIGSNIRNAIARFLPPLCPLRIGVGDLVPQILNQFLDIDKIFVDQIDILDVVHDVALVSIDPLAQTIQISSGKVTLPTVRSRTSRVTCLLESVHLCAELIEPLLERRQILELRIGLDLFVLQFLERVDDGGKVPGEQLLIDLAGDGHIEAVVYCYLPQFLHQLYCNKFQSQLYPLPRMQMQVLKLLPSNPAKWQTCRADEQIAHRKKVLPLLGWSGIINILIMLSGQNYKEFIEEQGAIETNIAGGWGYQLNPQEYIPKKQKVRSNLKVASIEPLKQIYDLPVSKELEQVEEELLMLQNERKLNQLTEKAFQTSGKDELPEDEESAAIKMMRQCVQQYNFIIDHRHIAEKNTEKARKILGIQRSESKELFEEIHSLKEQLGHSTLATTIKINSQIAQLYKKYSSILPKSNNCSERLTTQNKSSVNRAFTSVNNSGSYLGTSKLSPNKRTGQRNSSEKQSDFKDSQTKKESNVELKDLMIMQELNESEQGSSLQSSQLLEEELRFQPQSLLVHHAMTKLQRRVSEYAPPRRRFVTVVDAKQREKQERQVRMATTVEQAYEKKEVIHKGKKLDKMLQEHHDVIDVWRHRINEHVEKNKSFQLRFQPKAKKFKSLRNTKKPENEVKVEESKAKYTKISYKAEELQQSLAEKEKILSMILRKKESKYKRIPGTQILQKNDVNSTAKVFLGISKHNDPPSLPKRPNNDFKTADKANLQGPEWQRVEGNDEKLYWSMCKNQKLNLLLKNHKQQ